MDKQENIFQQIRSAFTPDPQKKILKKQIENSMPMADFPASTGSYRSLFTVSYNGEKNLGEIGPVIDYRIDHYGLRMRSHEAYLTNEIVSIIVNRFSTWVIGKGLKLQCEPIISLLNAEGIEIDKDEKQEFCDVVESRFNLFAESDLCDAQGMKNLGMIENTAYKNAKVGGDVLVILRYVDGFAKVQLIDGMHVQSPAYGSEYYAQQLDNGNKIVNGVEMDKNGKHVAYHVRTFNYGIDDYKFERIECRSTATGLKVAFLVSGLEYRIDNVRSIPAISTTLETLKKLERYKEATLGKAEEIAKHAYQITHSPTAFSTGENPLQGILAKASGVGKIGDLPVDDTGNALAKTVGVSVNKQVFNLPLGAKLEPVEGGNGTLHFKDFYSVNIDLICAAFGIPPEVALSKYDSNFSSARAAIKDWEHTLMVERAKFAFEFAKPFFNFWLEIEILSLKILAPGYLIAKLSKNEMVLMAYRNCRFVGSPVPHIDPLKEVMAERLKLGDTSDSIPLTTVEQATENLNGGESEDNMEQYSEELGTSKKLKLEQPVVKPTVPAGKEPNSFFRSVMDTYIKEYIKEAKPSEN